MKKYKRKKVSKWKKKKYRKQSNNVTKIRKMIDVTLSLKERIVLCQLQIY